MTIWSICRNKSVGKFAGMRAALVVISSRKAVMPEVESMFVDIDLASAVKSKAESGSRNSLSSLIKE
jgi:hypothetical protein